MTDIAAGAVDSLTPTLGFDDFLLQALNPYTAVDHFAHFAVALRSTLLMLGIRSKLPLLSLNRRVLAYEDAPFGVFQVLPAWMRMPSNFGTPSRMASHAFIFGLHVILPLVYPYGFG